jgi:secreted trypsin-like serine protease
VLIAAVLAIGTAVPAAQSSAPDPIVGGEPATAGEYPAQSFVEIDFGGGVGWFCGGTLVAPTKILTAAHCVTDGDGDDEVPAASVTAFIGETNRENFDASHEYAVSGVDAHDGFDGFTFVNDVAMLTLSRTSLLQPLRVVGSDDASMWAPGVTATIVGWGTTSWGGDDSPILLEAEVPLVSDTTCSNAYEDSFDPETMVCAYDGEHDTCQGDSGGPLMVPDGDDFVLAGITSWGEGCAFEDRPGVYTRIGATGLNTWISARLGGASPPPPPPPPPPPAPPPPPPPADAPAPRIVRCAVPRLRGKTLAAARRALARGNCRLGKVTRAYSTRVRFGRVVLQRPAAGRRLARGTRVSVVVSRGRRR